MDQIWLIFSRNGDSKWPTLRDSTWLENMFNTWYSKTRHISKYNGSSKLQFRSMYSICLELKLCPFICRGNILIFPHNSGSSVCADVLKGCVYDHWTDTAVRQRATSNHTRLITYIDTVHVQCKIGHQ